MRSRRLRIAVVVVALAALIPLGYVQKSIDNDRFLYSLGEPLEYWRISELNVQGVTGVIIGAVMGGFRGVAADMLWLKCDEYFHTGNMQRLIPAAQTIVMLDPHFIDVWTVTGWHMAYNMFAEAQAVGDWDGQVRWFNMGINWLMRGFQENPDSAEMAFNIGWTYYDRMDRYPEAVQYLTKTLRSEAPPRHTGRLVGHAYELMPDTERALEWYYRVLRVTPDDGTARGATITLKMRFAHAWRLVEEEKYDEAYQEIYSWLAAPHGDTPNRIPWHMMATIAEKQGKYDLALKWWERSANQYQLDELAQRRIHALRRQLGMPAWERVYPGWDAPAVIEE